MLPDLGWSQTFLGQLQPFVPCSSHVTGGLFHFLQLTEVFIPYLQLQSETVSLVALKCPFFCSFSGGGVCGDDIAVAGLDVDCELKAFWYVQRDSSLWGQARCGRCPHPQTAEVSFIKDFPPGLPLCSAASQVCHHTAAWWHRTGFPSGTSSLHAASGGAATGCQPFLPAAARGLLSAAPGCWALWKMEPLAAGWQPPLSLSGVCNLLLQQFHHILALFLCPVSPAAAACLAWEDRQHVCQVEGDGSMVQNTESLLEL